MFRYYQTYNTPSSEGIWQSLKNSFQQGSALLQLIYINIGVFLAFKLLGVALLLFGYSEPEAFVLPYVGVSALPEEVVYTPWTLFTYMFTQFSLLHLLFNMLWLYWFGNLFRHRFSSRQLVGVYLLGGICGALFYLAAYAIFPAFSEERYASWAIGASASVMAIVFAVCCYLPNQQIHIFLIGPVRLIHLALLTALIDLLSIPSGNAGGHIAHLGGAFFGYLFTAGIHHHRDLTAGFIRILEKIGQFFTKKRSRMKYKVQDMNDQEYNTHKKKRDDRINDILDKISKSGYESLTKEEKEILFKADRH